MRLTALFQDRGGVRVEKENQSAIIKPFKTQLQLGNLLTNWQFVKGEASGEEYVVRCPFCQDKSGHLHINHLSYSIPIAGDSSAALSRAGLLAKCFRRNCMKNPDNRTVLDSLIRDLDPAGLPEATIFCEKEDDRILAANLSLDSGINLESFKSWVPDYEAWESAPAYLREYMAGRGINPATCAELNIGWGPILNPNTGKYLLDRQPFVLFPIIDDTGLRGLQARFPGDIKMKYWFHPYCKRNTLLYNIPRALKTGICGLCEGIFDALKIGNSGVCAFGHTPSKSQKLKIESRFADGALIWFPDTKVNVNSATGKVELDPVAIAEQQVKEWNSRDVFRYGAHVVKLTGKDAGEMTTFEIWKDAIDQLKEEPLLLDLIDNNL